MAANDQNVKKGQLVEQLAKKLARLSKEELATLADAIERGTIDFAGIARDAARTVAAEDGPQFGFQRRLQAASRAPRDSPP